MTIGILLLAGGMAPGADARVVAIPMLLMGAGLGALASQLGAVTVSAVPESRSAEVGGLQNTATYLGAPLGTALIGSILIATLTSSVTEGIENNPAGPASVQQQATTVLADGVPFLSDTQLRDALAAGGRRRRSTRFRMIPYPCIGHRRLRFGPSAADSDNRRIPDPDSRTGHPRSRSAGPLSGNGTRRATTEPGGDADGCDWPIVDSIRHVGTP
jgi:hypothetical protein